MANFRLEDYETVEERLRRFWDAHPDGRVMTTLVHHGEGQYIVYAEVWRSAGELPAASGLAEEKEGSTFVNKTSALENCETSAVGRALAQLGLAPSGKRPSREEMSKASGAEAGGVSAKPAQDPAPDPSVGEGEASADLGSGEQTNSPGSTKDAPGPPHYPLNPVECSHLNSRSGRLLGPRNSPRGPVCPRCGLSYVTIRESA